MRPTIRVWKGWWLWNWVGPLGLGGFSRSRDGAIESARRTYADLAAQGRAMRRNEGRGERVTL